MRVAHATPTNPVGTGRAKIRRATLVAYRPGGEQRRNRRSFRDSDSWKGSQKMQITKSKKVAAVLGAGGGAGAGSGIAFAYGTSSGTGTGSASAGTSSAVTLTGITA